MKWEYMIVEIGVDTSSSEKRLKELGDNRWEAVSVWPLLSTIRILFKRPLKSK
jgi:hypothetical protein